MPERPIKTSLHCDGQLSRGLIRPQIQVYQNGLRYLHTSLKEHPVVGLCFVNMNLQTKMRLCMYIHYIRYPEYCYVAEVMIQIAKLT